MACFKVRFEVLKVMIWVVMPNGHVDKYQFLSEKLVFTHESTWY
jgi:hypothetical protein